MCFFADSLAPALRGGRVPSARSDNFLQAFLDISNLQDHLCTRSVRRYWANCMGPEGSLYERGSRLNHSCAPNCSRITLNSSTGGGAVERAFITLRPVAAGEELTLSYLPSGIEVMGTVVRRRHLWSSRGFVCNCARCSQPQDDIRQVACPECSRERGTTGSGPLAAQPDRADRYHAPEKGEEEPQPEEGAAFADWWNQSGMWVCRSCGWCSRVDSDDGETAPRVDSLHHDESVLSADMLGLVMADVPGQPAPDKRCCSSSEAAREEGRGKGGSGGSLRRDSAGRQARRDGIKGMLQRSVTQLGERHWVTFSCAHMRLKEEIAGLFSSGRGSRPLPFTSTPSLRESSSSQLPSPSQLPELLDWAVRELSGLWQWLSAALGPAKSHPPAYYLFDVVCDLLDAMRGSPPSSANGKLQHVLGRVDEWVSVFADNEQRLRFTAAVKTVNL